MILNQVYKLITYYAHIGIIRVKFKNIQQPQENSIWIIILLNFGNVLVNSFQIISKQLHQYGELIITGFLLPFSALMLLVGWQEGHRKDIRPECWGAGTDICLGRGVDLHMAQLMPLPLTDSCSSKSRLVSLFWYRLTWVISDKGPLNGCCFGPPCVIWSLRK